MWENILIYLSLKNSTWIVAFFELAIIASSLNSIFGNFAGCLTTLVHLEYFFGGSAVGAL